MLSFVTRSRVPGVLAVVVTVVGAGACGDATGGDTGEAQVAVMRLSVSNRQISVNQLGEVTNGPAILRAGIPAVVTATFLTITGEPDPRVVPATYQLNATVVEGGSLTITRSLTDPFTVTIVGTVPRADYHVRFSLYNVEAQHDTWGPFEVPFHVDA